MDIGRKLRRDIERDAMWGPRQDWQVGELVECYRRDTPGIVEWRGVVASVSRQNGKASVVKPNGRRVHFSARGLIVDAQYIGTQHVQIRRAR